jgi:cephalosporin-C deacetylase-like acetyl esterase
MKAFEPFLDGYCNVHLQLYEHLRDRNLNAVWDHIREKNTITTADQVRARAHHVRQAFLDSLGGIPQTEAPLNPKSSGVVRREGYAIEKITYESQPGVYVTSLLYLPDKLENEAPAVLFLCGHAREAKAYPEYQRVCHDLAINGFVVLAIDPTGQGERVTHYDPDTGAMPIPWGTTEHSYQGLQCVLTGTNIARYFLFDAMRGLDYLASRSEVDAARLGVTGNSGGGTQTTLLCMAGDERVKAAVPCTYVTSREHYYVTGQAQDAEQLQFGMTRDGINYDDMFLPFAPRPLLIGAVESDFFTPEGTVATHERLRAFYRILGHEDHVECVFAPGTHSYCRELREAAVNWFRGHLMGAEPDFTSAADEAIPVSPESELWCTSKGHVLTDEPKALTPFHLNLAIIPERLEPPDADTLRNAVIDTLAIRDRIESPERLYPRVVKTRHEKGVQAHSVFFISERNVMVAGCLVHRPEVSPSEAVIYLAPGGTNALDLHIDSTRDLLDAGKAVFAFDVRGTGAVESVTINAHELGLPGLHYHTENRFAYDAYCMSESLLGMRVYDVLRAAHYLREMAAFDRLGIRARGLQPALWAYLAAALDVSLETVQIDNLIPSFEAIARTQLYTTAFTPASMLHGVLERFDLPDLMLLFDGRDVQVREEPVEWCS